ncbi:type II toxin-antitoxin system RelE/ParE family toxin [Vibrio parahaemolyticus]|uniref:type II toxin-antitoxin system RelE/ParE family toxin n=1 Tax=Vibrio parahaemolyticus TaxID=670 RepID=UPI003D816AB5
MEFRDSYLEDFYENDVAHRKIPSNLENVLFRKLQMLDAATDYRDLLIPPNNQFEHLNGKLAGYSCIRVNRQYRLIFKFIDGEVVDTYLDPHSYR